MHIVRSTAPLTAPTTSGRPAGGRASRMCPRCLQSSSSPKVEARDPSHWNSVRVHCHHCCCVQNTLESPSSPFLIDRALYSAWVSRGSTSPTPPPPYLARIRNETKATWAPSVAGCQLQSQLARPQKTPFSGAGLSRSALVGGLSISVQTCLA